MYLAYKRDFYINCEYNGTTKIRGYPAKNEVHLCTDNTMLVNLLNSSAYVEVMISTVVNRSECEDDVKENEIKLIAATLRCNKPQAIQINCPFM